jgi:hypothetical protein
MNDMTVNLKTFPLQKNYKYSFTYNQVSYNSEFISKQNELNVFPKTIFKFKDFTLSNHMFKPFIVQHFQTTSFSDSESESDNSEENSEKISTEENSEKISTEENSEKIPTEQNSEKILNEQNSGKNPEPIDTEVHEIIQDIMNEIMQEMMYELDYFFVKETLVNDDDDDDYLFIS